MAKKTFQDIIPPERRSIRNLSLPKQSETKEEKHVLKSHKQKEVSENTQKEEDIWIPQESNPSKIRVWLLAIICLSALATVVVFLISKAEISVTIKKYDIKMENDLYALKSPSDANGLIYSSISLKDSGSLSVEATGQKNISSIAHGRIIIYNNLTTPQKLISGTHLSDPKGLIFMTDKSITIPARKTKLGKIVPGSMEVEIHAEKPGNIYNVGLTDFSIVAFKDDPRNTNVYGRSKTPISGGEQGVIAVIDDALASTTKIQIENDLAKKIISEARAQVPDNFILLNNSYEIDFGLEAPTLSENKAIIKESAALKGYIFDKTKLVSYLSSIKNIPIESDPLIKIDSSDLSIGSISEDGDKLKMHLSGILHITYDLDKNSLKKDLQGKSKVDALKILGNYVAIDKAKITTTPLWNVPNNTDRISIIVSN